MTEPQKRIETRLVHAGEPRPLINGAVSMPIYQSSTYEYFGIGGYDELKYIRMNNTPNHVALHKKLAALENGEAGLVCSSGMAAISTTLLALLAPGDHFLAQSCLYGGTHNFLTEDLTPLGVTYDFIEGGDPESWEKAVTPKTRLLYVETITNPLMEVADLKAAAAFAEKHGLISVIDNTFASPVNFRPPEWGIDLSIHSCTKYLNGHSDIVAGAIIGPADLVEKINHKLIHLGGTLDPHACFLLHRGLKTLAVRIKHQNESALTLARFFHDHPAVERINYPGLESHPDHARAAELLDGFGGMLSLELKGGLEKALEFIQHLEIPISAPSLGGPETLISRPSVTSHSGMTPEERTAAGISDRLIRISVGLEAAEDLMEDFGRSLNRIDG